MISNMMLKGFLIAVVTLLSCNAASVIPTTINKIPAPSSSRNAPINIPAPSSRIINGFYVAETSFTIPWVVALFQYGQSFCTGSLINNQFILTAGHCVVSKPSDPNGQEMCSEPFHHKSEIQAIIGASDYDKAKHNPNKVHNVIQHWIHDQYAGGQCGNWNFDFAILKLARPVSITPVCLHSGDRIDKYKAYALGYGATAPHGNQGMSNHLKGVGMSNHLKGVELKIVPNEQCSKQHGADVGDNKVCCTVGYTTDTYFAGTCRGDSGGPLVLYDSSYGFIQVGVTSYGSSDQHYNCAGHAPEVFSRVSSALSFIKSKAGSIKTC